MIKKIKIKDNGNPGKKLLALFRHDDDSLHLVCKPEPGDDDGEVTYDDTIYYVVRGDKVNQMLEGRALPERTKETLKIQREQLLDSDDIDELGLL